MPDKKPLKGAQLDLLRAVWNRRKWLALAAFAVPLTVGFSVAVFMPLIYRATATVLVDRQQVPETLVAPTVTSALETRLQTISQEILSRSRLQAMIARFSLYPELRKQVSPEEVIERMRNDIKLELKGVDVKGQRQATVAFTLSYLGNSPQTVALVTNTLASFYIEENLKVRERQASGTAQFLRVQLQDTKKRLDELEGSVSEFKRRYLGELPQQMDANLATLERLQMQLRLNADGQTRARERRTFLAAQFTESGSNGGTGTPESASARLAKLRHELVELRARYTEQHPRVIHTEATIAAMTRELAGAKAKGKELDAAELASPSALRLREVLTEAETDLKVLKAEEGRLQAAIVAYQQRVEKIPQREQEFKELSRDYETTREFYQSLLKRHDEAQIAESMEQRQKGEQFRVIEPAVPPEAPAANRLRLIVITILFSVGLGVTAAVLAEQIDASFHTAEELRGHTSLPLLVTIPRILTEADAHRNRTRFRLVATAAGLGLIALVGLSYLLAHGNEQLVWLVSKSSS
jgi:polysaccharide chain length determinant protein (PEP-CTERM system associated)